MEEVIPGKPLTRASSLPCGPFPGLFYSRTDWQIVLDCMSGHRTFKSRSHGDTVVRHETQLQLRISRFGPLKIA